MARPPVRQRRQVRTLAAGMAALLLSAGCEGSANGADSTLKSLHALEIVRTPPPHSRKLGSADDRGSRSSVTGRAAATITVFATSTPVRAVEAYYQRTYREYRLAEDCCATSSFADLTGSSPHAVLGVTIASGKPHLPPHFAPKLASAPSGATTYVTVFASGLGSGS